MSIQFYLLWLTLLRMLHVLNPMTSTCTHACGKKKEKKVI